MCSWQSIKEPQVGLSTFVENRTSMAFSSFCLVKFKLPAKFCCIIIGCLSTFSDNAACCGDLYCCNSGNGLIYFIATDVDFHASFVQNVCRQQNLCGWSFLNLSCMKWGINHTRRARFDICLPVHIKFEQLLVIQINHPTRCNNFSSLLLDVYLQLNMWGHPKHVELQINVK
jgi:hypothetical protein